MIFKAHVIKTYLIIAFTGTLLVGFQNCSKYNYKDVSSSDAQGLSTDQLGDNSDTILNQQPEDSNNGGLSTPTQEMPASLPPTEQVSNPPVANEPPAVNPPVINEPPVIPPVASEPPASNPPVINEPPTLPPVAVEPPVTNPPVSNDPAMPPVVSQPPIEVLPPVILPPVVVEPPAVVPPIAVEPPLVLPPVAVEPPPVSEPPVSQPPTTEPPVVQNPPSLPPVVTTPPSEEENCVNWAYEKKDHFSKTNFAFKHSDDDDEDDDQDREEHHSANSDEGKKYQDKNSKPVVSASSFKSGLMSRLPSYKKDDDDHEQSNEHSDKASCGKDHEKKETVAVEKNKCFVSDDDMIKDNDFERFCQMNKKQIKAMNIIGRVLNSLHLRGFTVITSETVGADSVDTIEDVRGHLIVCDLEVKKIDDTRGMVSLINSKVNTLNDHRGIAVLYNSVVDNCTNIKGVIAILGDKSVCNRVEKSTGIVQVRRNH